MDISIIVPFRDGEKCIDRFMNGYFVQKGVQGIEIELLFISNLSTDNTGGVISNYIEKYNLNNVQVLYFNEKPSSYAARNYGVRRAKGKLLIFTDIDCRICENFLIEIWNKFKYEQFKALAGRIIIEVENRSNYWELYDSYFNMDNEKMLLRNRIATADFAIEKNTFKKIGEFVEFISSGDSEFGERLYKAGIKVQYNEKAIVYHPSRKTYDEMEKKLLRIAYGEGQRAKLDKLNIHKMKIIYFLKAFNFLHLKRIWNKMKKDISFSVYIRFVLDFTRIRLRQIGAFCNGFNGIELINFNK